MIEHMWFTKSGYRAVVLMLDTGHRCGYVEIPHPHPCYEKEYSDINVNVHNGLTFSAYSSEMPYAVPEGFWVLGFDCIHSGDAIDLEAYDRYSNMGYLSKTQEDISYVFNAIFTNDTVRTLDFVVAECESLATQLKEMELPSTVLHTTAMLKSS
jgi:hypothetical protein